MRTSTSTNTGVVLVLLALAGGLIAGCGDSDSEPSDPQIPAAVAGRLAELSDETADELAAGDGCAAQETVDELEHQVELTKVQVPAELRPELEAGVQKLAGKIDCIPLPPVTEEPAPAPVEEEKPKEKPKKPKPEKKEPEPVECPPGQEKQGESCVAKHEDTGEGDEGGEHGNGGGPTGGTDPDTGEGGGK